MEESKQVWRSLIERAESFSKENNLESFGGYAWVWEYPNGGKGYYIVWHGQPGCKINHGENFKGEGTENLKELIQKLGKPAVLMRERYLQTGIPYFRPHEISNTIRIGNKQAIQNTLELEKELEKKTKKLDEHSRSITDLILDPKENIELNIARAFDLIPKLVPKSRKITGLSVETNDNGTTSNILHFLNLIYSPPERKLIGEYIMPVKLEYTSDGKLQIFNI